MIIGRGSSKTSRFSVVSVHSSDNPNCSPQEVLFERLASDSTYDHARLSSRKERQEDPTLSKEGSLTYGELPYKSMKEIIDIINDDMSCDDMSNGSEGSKGQQRLFLDLGSGSGRSTLSALLHDSSFTEAVGIEIMSGLYRMSLTIKEKCAAEPELHIAPLSFYHASIFDMEAFDWVSHAKFNFSGCSNVIFANSTCFGDDFMQRIADMCSSLYCSYVVTLTTPIYHMNCNLDIIREVRLSTSWGSADVYVQKVVRID